MNRNKTNQAIPEGPIARTTKHIAFILLAIYAICLVAVLIAAFKEDPSNGRIWFDLFKSGFLLLGGALTTLIGYYFGNRGVQEADANTAIALGEIERKEKEIERKEKEMEEEKIKALKLKDEVTDMYAEIVSKESLKQEQEPLKEEQEEH